MKRYIAIFILLMVLIGCQQREQESFAEYLLLNQSLKESTRIVVHQNDRLTTYMQHYFHDGAQAGWI